MLPLPRASTGDELDARRRYPEEFVAAMTEAGYLGVLIPEDTAVRVSILGGVRGPR